MVSPQILSRSNQRKGNFTGHIWLCGRKKCDFCKSGGKTLKIHEKLNESGGKTSKFGQNLVGVTGFEPAASTSQMSRATNCATPRFIQFYARILTEIPQLWDTMWS